MLGHQVYTAAMQLLLAAVCLAGTVTAGSSGSSVVEVLDIHRSSLPFGGHMLRDIRESRLVTAVLGRAASHVYTTNASLDLSWSNAELFSL